MKTTFSMQSIGLGLLFLSFTGAGLALRGASPETLGEPESGNLRSYIELVRRDVRAEKAMLLAENVTFTEDEAVSFWPLYSEYELELRKWYDRRLELIKEFFDKEETLTDSRARSLAEQVFTMEEARTDLKRKYFKKFAKTIGAKKAVRFFQVENQLNAAIDLRIAAALPLVK